MKYYIKSLLAVGFAAATLAACDSDEGNYDYLPDEEVSKIEFLTDSVAPEYQGAFWRSNRVGDTLEYDIPVIYQYPERLKYRWIVYKSNYNSYQPEQVGNMQVYPEGDTIGYEKKLHYVIALEPGQTYQIRLMAEDVVNGFRAWCDPVGQYFSMEEESVLPGVYMLVEGKDGNSDLEVVNSALQLITSGVDELYPTYYSQQTGSTIPGKPLWIRGSHSGKTSKDTYLVCTDQGVFRINSAGMTMMETKDDIFYTAPEVFNLQNAWLSTTSSMEAVINDGKLHVIYCNKANDRKWSAPIAGDYEADDYLMCCTYDDWRPVEGAINASQVIYDKLNHQFRPFYANATSISNFNATVPTAPIDANKLPADPVKIFDANGHQTYCIVPETDGFYLYRFNFYNRVDNGDLSADGARSRISLAGAVDIDQAKYFAGSPYEAFYYATDKAVHSFSPSTGNDVSTNIYTCEANEEITALYCSCSGGEGGGWPTSDCIFYVGIWDSQAGEGKVLEYEMDHSYGVPNTMWGPMFGGSGENPVVLSGTGKIKGFAWLDAE